MCVYYIYKQNYVELNVDEKDTTSFIYKTAHTQEQTDVKVEIAIYYLLRGFVPSPSALRPFSRNFVQKLLRPCFGFNWTFFCYNSLISHQKSLKDQKRPTKVIKAIVKAGGSE